MSSIKTNPSTNARPITEWIPSSCSCVSGTLAVPFAFSYFCFISEQEFNVLISIVLHMQNTNNLAILENTASVFLLVWWLQELCLPGDQLPGLIQDLTVPEIEKKNRDQQINNNQFVTTVTSDKFTISGTEPDKKLPIHMTILNKARKSKCSVAQNLE